MPHPHHVVGDVALGCALVLLLAHHPVCASGLSMSRTHAGAQRDLQNRQIGKPYLAMAEETAITLYLANLRVTEEPKVVQKRGSFGWGLPSPSRSRPIMQTSLCCPS